ncbi:hypothetical protein LTR56_018290 [Elasticomyces elasticus]|nr:hypothetical protein LTR56_018290 [Elasticomyces elasticus]KAK3636780.1 hypothetical protein LTR22_018595 [Elasticomyces elasticus]KAK5751849.1 hypothetical protein LTS12_018090 [Elasticomyces elasticus]
MAAAAITDPDLPNSPWEQNGRIFLDATIASQTAVAWRDVLDSRSTNEWFDDLRFFIPPGVKAAFNHDRPPTASELDELKYFPDHPGTYGEMLTPKATSKYVSNYLYNGTATHQLVNKRVQFHNKPGALIARPKSKYYQLKHGSDNYDSRPFSYAVVPMTKTMDAAVLGQRRVFCRLSEALFDVWTRCLDPAYPQTRSLSAAADTSFQAAYGNKSYPLEWVGLCTHSPLKETVGGLKVFDPNATALDPPPAFDDAELDNEAVGAEASTTHDAQISGMGGNEQVSDGASRNIYSDVPSSALLDRNQADLSPVDVSWEELMAGYAEVFGGPECVPGHLVERARRRYAQGATSIKSKNNREDYLQRQREDPVLMARLTVERQAYNASWRAMLSAEERQEVLDYNAAYYQNRMAAMTAADKEQHRYEQNLSTKKHKIKKARDAGVLSQAQYEAAEADEWRAQPDFPRGYSTLKPKYKLVETAETDQKYVAKWSGRLKQAPDMAALSTLSKKRNADGSLCADFGDNNVQLRKVTKSKVDDEDVEVGHPLPSTAVSKPARNAPRSSGLTEEDGDMRAAIAASIHHVRERDGPLKYVSGTLSDDGSGSVLPSTAAPKKRGRLVRGTRPDPAPLEEEGVEDAEAAQIKAAIAASLQEENDVAAPKMKKARRSRGSKESVESMDEEEAAQIEAAMTASLADSTPAPRKSTMQHKKQAKIGAYFSK